MKLVHREGFEKARAEKAIESYRKYLYLAAKGFHLSPEKDTDEAWHIHILDMQKYEADCNLAFGRVIYHLPHRLDENGKAIKESMVPESAECGGMCHTCSCNTNCCAVPLSSKTDILVISQGDDLEGDCRVDKNQSGITADCDSKRVRAMSVNTSFDFETLVRATFPSN